MEPDELTQERIARNDALFRETNEQIREHAEKYDIEWRVPFICECADLTCRKFVPLTLEQYGAVRANPRRFINMPGHEEGPDRAARVVEKHDAYVVVEKTGRAGEVAEELVQEPDPR